MAANNSRVLVILDPENVNHTSWELAMVELRNMGLEPTFQIAATDKPDYLSLEYQQAIVNAGFEFDVIETSSSKDGADICLISRALQIYYRSGYDVAFFISYDSDFQTLARILNEEGVHTMGIDGERFPAVMRPILSETVTLPTVKLAIHDTLASEIKALVSSPHLTDDHGWMHYESIYPALLSMVNREMGQSVSVKSVLEAIPGITYKANKAEKSHWLRLGSSHLQLLPSLKAWQQRVESKLTTILVKSYDDLVALSEYPLVSFKDLLAHSHNLYGVTPQCFPKALQYSKKSMLERLNDVTPHLEFHGWSDGSVMAVRPEYKRMAA